MSYICVIIYLIFICSYACCNLSRILGGQDAPIREHPYQAVLRRITDNWLICGGAIITHKHILTAAHCVDNQFISQSNIKINTGASNQSQIFLYEYLPKKIFIHPKFWGTYDHFGTPNNDIAIIQIHENMAFNAAQNMIGLPNRNIENGEMAKIIGWGTVTHPEVNFASKLQQATMTIINPNDCQHRFPINIYQDQFCAFNNLGVGPCIGDGGSPLVINYYVFGIYSMSHLCAAGVPDVYTNVFSHIKFIRAVIRS